MPICLSWFGLTFVSLYLLIVILNVDGQVIQDDFKIERKKEELRHLKGSPKPMQHEEDHEKNPQTPTIYIRKLESFQLENIDELEQVAYMSLRNFNITDESLLQRNWLSSLNDPSNGRGKFLKSGTSNSAVKSRLAIMLESFIWHLRNGHLRRLKVDELALILSNLNSSSSENIIPDPQVNQIFDPTINSSIKYDEDEASQRCKYLVTIYKLEREQPNQEETTGELVKEGGGKRTSESKLYQLCKLAVNCQSPDDLASLIGKSIFADEADGQSELEKGRQMFGENFGEELEPEPMETTISGSNTMKSSGLKPGKAGEMRSLRDSLSISLAKLCPMMLFQLHDDEGVCTVRRDDRPPSVTVWAFATLFVTIVSFCSLIGLSITPLLGGAGDAGEVSSSGKPKPRCSRDAFHDEDYFDHFEESEKRERERVFRVHSTEDEEEFSSRGIAGRGHAQHRHRACLTLFEGLAVGSLVGSALFSLIPQAFELQERESNQGFLLKALIIFFGIYLFFCSERLMRIILDNRQQRKKCKRLNPRSSNSVPMMAASATIATTTTTKATATNPTTTSMTPINSTLLPTMAGKRGCTMDRGGEHERHHSGAVLKAQKGFAKGRNLLEEERLFCGQEQDYVRAVHLRDESRLSAAYLRLRRQKAADWSQQQQQQLLDTFSREQKTESELSGGKRNLAKVSAASQIAPGSIEEHLLMVSGMPSHSSGSVKRSWSVASEQRRSQQALNQHTGRVAASASVASSGSCNLKRAAFLTVPDATFEAAESGSHKSNGNRRGEMLLFRQEQPQIKLQQHLAARNRRRRARKTRQQLSVQVKRRQQQLRRRLRRNSSSPVSGSLGSSRSLSSYAPSSSASSFSSTKMQDFCKKYYCNHNNSTDVYSFAGSRSSTATRRHRASSSATQRLLASNLMGMSMSREVDDDEDDGDRELIRSPTAEVSSSRVVQGAQDISTVAWMIILGDGLHNFIDGISIGAAFAESILSGVSISVAVICEEFPHELGDFAVLVSSGMTVRQALGYNFLSACTCYLGMVVGIVLGDVNESASYISALAAGVFLYIALVDMMGELSAALEETSRDSITRTLKLFFLQNVGIFIGISIIFVLSFIDF